MLEVHLLVAKHQYGVKIDFKIMKITASKIKRELIENHNWSSQINEGVMSDLIKDVLSVIDKSLRFHKGISIK